MEFGHYLREKREAKGMTIRQLALYSGCSKSYISLIERGETGKQRTKPETLKKLAKPLGVPFEVLMERAGYTADLIEPESEVKTVMQVLRESLGETKEQFAVRVGLHLDELEAMERQEVSVETIQLICEQLFAPHRSLTPTQKMLIHRVEETFHQNSSEISRLVERILHAVLDTDHE